MFKSTLADLDLSLIHKLFSSVVPSLEQLWTEDNSSNVMKADRKVLRLLENYKMTKYSSSNK